MVAQVAPQDSDSIFEDRDLFTRYPLRVLLAEDDLVNQRITALLLYQFGYNVDYANNGEEVLHALERKEYDLILMDDHMPILDGIETSKIIRRDREGELPVIVAMTLMNAQQERERFQAAGMNDGIVKPLRVAELRELLERWGSKLIDGSDS